MEKSGSIYITQAELDIFLAAGQVPLSLKDRWQLSDEEMADVIRSGNYVVIPNQKQEVNTNERS